MISGSQKRLNIQSFHRVYMELNWVLRKSLYLLNTEPLIPILICLLEVCTVLHLVITVS